LRRDEGVPGSLPGRAAVALYARDRPRANRGRADRGIYAGVSRIDKHLDVEFARGDRDSAHGLASIVVAGSM
jgi:hypothetical protein